VAPAYMAAPTYTPLTVQSAAPPPQVAPVYAQPPPAAAAPARRRHRVVFEYQSSASDELTIRLGDIVTVLREDSGDWWTVELNGRTGLVPTVMLDLAPLSGATAVLQPTLAHAHTDTQTHTHTHTHTHTRCVLAGAHGVGMFMCMCVLWLRWQQSLRRWHLRQCRWGRRRVCLAHRQPWAAARSRR
jgi:uncharacterized membrane protein